MAAAVLSGIVIALAAILFNFSVHKIDEGETRCREAKSEIAIVLKSAINTIWSDFVLNVLPSRMT